MNTQQIFRQHNNLIASEIMEDVITEEKISRVEKFDVWMKKIQNIHQHNYKSMCHARAKVAANSK